MRDLPSSFVPWLIAICLPSAAMTWSLLHRVAKPVFIISGFAGRIGGEFVQFSPAIIHEPLAVGCPVWSFDKVGEFFDYGAPAVCYVQYFQYAGYVVLLGGCERRESR